MKKIIFLLMILISFHVKSEEMNADAKDLKLGIVLFDGFDQLDVTGPFEIFNDYFHTKVYFISNTLHAVKSSQGIQIMPNVTFQSSPQMDILFVPGGPGIIHTMQNNPSLIQFIQNQSPKLKYLTSVCTGSLLLAYAGELNGYKATSHWLAKKYLPNFGVTLSKERIVVDRNRITAAGVTSGIDLALELGKILFGNNFVEYQELMLEYNPKPPIQNLTNKSATPEALNLVSKSMGKIIKKRDDFFNSLIKNGSRLRGNDKRQHALLSNQI